MFTDLTDGAVVRRLVPCPRPQHRFFAGWDQSFLHRLALLQCSQEAVPESGTSRQISEKYTTRGGSEGLRDSLDHLEQLVVWHLDVACHIPGQVHHGNHGLDTLELVPLVTLHSQLVLVGWKRSRESYWTQEAKTCVVYKYIHWMMSL